MNYKTLTFIIALLLSVSCISTRNSKIDKNKLISFRWEGFDFENKHYPYGVMLVPVRIDSIKKEFEMQFDLGLNVNVIYENPLKTILAEQPTLNKQLFEREEYEILYSRLNIGQLKSSIDSIFVYNDYGTLDSYDEVKLIGSIGFNEIEDKILIIDYPNKTLQIINDLYQIDEQKFVFTPLEVINNGKIKINLTINNKNYPFLFDTGAGVVPIATIDNALYKQTTIINHNKQDTITANSWGEPTTIIGNQITDNIKIGDYNLKTENKRFYYTDNKNQKEFFQDLDLFGSIGNVFFIENTIVLDLKNNRFGIKIK